MGEVAVLDFWAVVHIRVAAMEAPADDLARFGFGASAFAMGQCRFPLVARLDKPAVIGLGRDRFRNAPCLLGCMLGSGAKLDGAHIVVVSLHQDTAEALAVSAALPVVPRKIAIVTMAYLSPNLLLSRLRPFASAHSPACWSHTTGLSSPFRRLPG
jgi:hypothetical protein